MYVLVACYTAWLLADAAITIYNICTSFNHKPQLNVVLGWRFAHDVSYVLQLVTLLIPRQLIIWTGMIGMGFLLYLLLKFKREPDVPDFLESEDDYPSIDFFLPRY